LWRKPKTPFFILQLTNMSQLPKKMWATCLPFLLLSAGVFAQPRSFVFGLGLKLKVDLSYKRTSHYAISASAGAGRVFKDHFLFTYNLSANLYRGGLGNSMLPSKLGVHQLDLDNAFAVSYGDRGYAFTRPLYTWSPNQSNWLSNPFRNSATLAINFLWNNHGRNQQIGHIGLAFGDATLGYYNDGSPFHLNGTGDYFDRWWTGGGYLHVGNEQSEWQFLYTFDKFTGFQPDAFEIANILRMSDVMYQDVQQSTLNRGRNAIGLLHRSGMGFNLSMFNALDIQDGIHQAMHQAFHPSPYHPNFFLGFQYQYVNQGKQ
jgi:hypothetical protein